MILYCRLVKLLPRVNEPALDIQADSIVTDYQLLTFVYLSIKDEIPDYQRVS